jgi:hypothetical protein
LTVFQLLLFFGDSERTLLESRALSIGFLKDSLALRMPTAFSAEIPANPQASFSRQTEPREIFTQNARASRVGEKVIHKNKNHGWGERPTKSPCNFPPS